jgi:hypothetical protein
MNTKTHEPKIIGMRELLRNSKGVTKASKLGVSFLVMTNTTPAFRIEPAEEVKKKKYTKKDLEKIQFRSGERNLSQRIDEILYGI